MIRRILQSSILQATLTSLVLALCLAGCANQQTGSAPANQTTTTTTTTTASSSPSPSPTPESRAEADLAPLTLPVLDAFFADEDFPAELKTKLQLTDEQVQRLRATAREETAKLRETDANQNYTGTTTAARTRATEQLKAIIGPEKTEQLAALVRERWNNGGNEETAGGSDKGAGTSTGATTNNSSTNTPAAGTKALNAVPTDTRIVVNAPAYRMDVFEKGTLVKSYKVGIGYPEFPLPTGLRRAKQIIFNPPWTPPDSPWVEASNHVKAGEKIEPGSKLNPLGLLKIPIGPPSLIHGGKSPARIGGFASHGCVGLTDTQVRDFAKVLARSAGSEISDEDINGFVKDRTETKTVNLKSAIPVELRYETIVVEDGKLHIYRDVYDRDTNTEENLKAVLAVYGVTLDQLSEDERTKVLSALREMSRDANGKLDQNATPTSDAPNTAQRNDRDEQKSNKNDNKNANRNDNRNEKKTDASDSKVTRTIKGQKEIVIELSALRGKGYPAPVDLDTGSGTKKSASN